MMSEHDSEVGEWVEIVEPSTKRHLFANLETGDCSWNVPLGAKVKKYSDESDQWWELFDKETKRFYYYNVSMQKTVWKKPSRGDIIPLMKLQTLTQNFQTAEEMESVPSTDVMRRDHRRTASARYNRDTSAPGALYQRSSHNQSQRKAKEDHAVGQSHSAATDVPAFEQNSSKPRLSRSDKRDEPQPQHWLSRSFDQSDACASGSTSTSGAIPDPKRPSSNQISSLALNGQSNFSMTGCHDGQRMQRNCLDELCSFSDEPRRRIRAGNSSIDSGITTDLSCAPYEASCISLPNSSSSDRHLNCDGAQFSGGAQRIERCCEPLQEMTELTSSVLSSVQMTPGSQRRAFPRTNPKFAVGQKVSGQKTALQTNQVLNAIPDFGTSNSLLLDQDVLQQSSSSSSNRQQVDGAVFSHLRYKTDKIESSGQKTTSDSVTKSTSSGVRRSADSATCDTSFSFRKFPPEALNPSTSANRTFRSVSSTSSNEYENGRMAPSAGLKRDSPGIVVHDVSEKPAQKQSSGTQFIVEEDRLEECRRTRRNSEPDYANLQEIAAREEAMAAACAVVQNNSADRDFGRTRSVRAKAEPVYANEHLTGRGCLTHEDRYHLPSFTGNRDGSLGSTGSSTISTPSPKMQKRAAAHLSRETRHMSLRRKKLAEKPASQTSRSFVDKSRSLHSELIYQRPASVAVPVDPDVDSIVCQVADTLMLRADMEQFLSENLNMHRKGLLGKTVPLGNMLVWTKDPIQKPMIRTDNKVAKKEAPDVFKLIQTYMGDRKSKETEPCVAMELANKGWSVPELRDEIYVQLCRQTTKNPRDESLLNGWELLGICLSFFPPSAKFQSYLEGHICQTQESHDHTEGSKLHSYAVSCMRRLDKICQSGAARKPTQDDLERVRKSLLQPSMFGSTLEDIMDLQRDLFPAYQLPWVQVTLSEALLNFRGNRMPEGIFRVPGDVDEVNALQEKLDRWVVPSPRTDPHVLASVLKLWYRELYEPLIPDEFYDECVDNFDNPNGAIDLVNELPSRHKLVLTYLIKFLQKLASPEYSAITKMDASNLAMVMAPNCLRCNASNPQLMFENARKEMVFLRTLIQNLDASSIDCIK